MSDLVKYDGSQTSDKFFVEDEFFDPNRVNYIYEKYKDVCIPPDFLWIGVDDINKHTNGSNEPVAELSQYCYEDLALFILDYLSVLLGRIRPCYDKLLNTSGFEVGFIQTKQPTTCQDPFLHIDADEGARAENGKPSYSDWVSLFHMGPGEGVGRGSTVFSIEDEDSDEVYKKCWSRLPMEDILKLPGKWISVDQKASRLVHFKGDLPHFAEPVESLPGCGRSRVVLLSNYWIERPSTFKAGQRFFRFDKTIVKSFLKLEIEEHELLYKLVDKLAENDMGNLKTLYSSLPIEDSFIRRISSPTAECLIIND